VAAAHISRVNFAKITGDRPRQSAYKIKLTLSRISEALAQISCLMLPIKNYKCAFEFAKVIIRIIVSFVFSSDTVKMAFSMTS